jgi:hypothetical protein
MLHQNVKLVLKCSCLAIAVLYCAGCSDCRDVQYNCDNLSNVCDYKYCERKTESGTLHQYFWAPNKNFPCEHSSEPDRTCDDEVIEHMEENCCVREEFDDSII